jgi:hypothetical protein
MAVRLHDLLEGFQECRQRADASAQCEAATARDRFTALLNGYGAAVERYRQRQEQVAEDFNLLAVMRLTGNEVRHSMVLAWLLDHDLRKIGTHAQGNLGFRLFLSELRLPVEYASYNYWVRREVAGEESIVDLEIAYRGRFLIHIENKIWAGEGPNQTTREWSDLQRRAADLNVNTTDVHAFFLTPHGTPAANPSFHAVSWSRVARILERFAEQAKPPDVRLFSDHYARALRRGGIGQTTTEAANGETTTE